MNSTGLGGGRRKCLLREIKALREQEWGGVGYQQRPRENNHKIVNFGVKKIYTHTLGSLTR